MSRIAIPQVPTDVPTEPLPGNGGDAVTAAAMIESPPHRMPGLPLRPSRSLDDLSSMPKGMRAHFAPRPNASFAPQIHRGADIAPTTTPPSAEPNSPAVMHLADLSVQAGDVRAAVPSMPATSTAPSPRDVNPLFGYDVLKAQLPEDVEGCVAHLFRSLEADVGDCAALVSQQAAVLRRHGIANRDQFVALVRSVSWRDYGTALLHGMASGSGMAIGSAMTDVSLAQEVSKFVGDMAQTDASVVGLIAGSAIGFMLSVMDVGSGPSASKTFDDAYFTRPLAAKLPVAWRGLRPQSRYESANEMQRIAGLTFGALRNGLLRAPLSMALEAGGQGATRSAIDAVLDPLTGAIFGSGGLRLGRNLCDEGAGRGGVQYFLARRDLDECLAFLAAPAATQVGSALGRLCQHVVNVGTTLPQAVKDAFTSKVGWVSHALLAPGFGGILAIVEGLPGALAARGISQETAGVLTQLTKFAALQCLYQGWGAAMGALAVKPLATSRDLEKGTPPAED